MKLATKIVKELYRMAGIEQWCDDMPFEREFLGSVECVDKILEPIREVLLEGLNRPDGDKETPTTAIMTALAMLKEK